MILRSIDLFIHAQTMSAQTTAGTLSLVTTWSDGFLKYSVEASAMEVVTVAPVTFPDFMSSQHFNRSNDAEAGDSSFDLMNSVASAVSVDDSTSLFSSLESDEDQSILSQAEKVVEPYVIKPSTSTEAVPAKLPPLKKQKSCKFDVQAILETTAKGKKACASITKDRILTNEAQRVIADMCAQHLIQNYCERPSSDVKEAMAHSIVVAFPCLKDPEGKGYEQWYTKGSKICTASGILENKLRNLRRSKVKEEQESVMFSEECDEGTSSENAVPVTHDDADKKKMEQIAEQMNHISDPSKVRDLMRETAEYRWSLLHSAECPDLAETLIKFPHLLDIGMIEQDYEVIFPEKANLLYEKWKVMSACILTYAASVAPQWKKKIGLDEEYANKTLNENERMNLAFFALPVLFEGRKSSKGGRVSSTQSLDFFIDFQKEGVGVDNYLREIPGEKTQPYILALGGRQANPQQQFVIVERKALETKTLLGAVSVCYKTYQVLDLKYSTPTQGIWAFFDSLIFGVKTRNEPGSIRAFRAYYHFDNHS
ncbi:uncharacterized protein LOC129272648 isoform X3 [Lytechinus pictus]|uniref:uncharacterized protein LOC129272648 isoform X3 n=1 Tax=Lytechinus pictus TaxID=7653 RepID=UPI0030B9F31A